MGLKAKKVNEPKQQIPLLNEVKKLVCVHDWKCISYTPISGIWVCKKCGKSSGLSGC